MGQVRRRRTEIMDDFVNFLFGEIDRIFHGKKGGCRMGEDFREAKGNK